MFNFIARPFIYLLAALCLGPPSSLRTELLLPERAETALLPLLTILTSTI